VTSFPISTLTVTYGRTAFLKNALYGLNHQDCPVPYQIVILNTCPQQRLTVFSDNLGFPNVKVVNLDRRPACLGEARNIGVAACDGRVIRVVDDDDFVLSGDLRLYADAFAQNPDCAWILINSQFYMERDTIKAISPGAMHQFAFTKESWQAVGGYPALTCGEDRGFVSALQERFTGKKITPAKPQYVYCWSQGSFHASGSGDDVPGGVKIHDRIGADLENRIRAGSEPVGNVLIKPALKHDYERMAAEFLAKSRADAPTLSDRCYVILGRNGDIVNALPFIYKDFLATGVKPRLAISREFRDILDGVSYVKPWLMRRSFGEINDALLEARSKFANVINCQIWGWNYTQDRRCATFNEESWRMAGFLAHFHDFKWPLVFDNRDWDKERVMRERAFSIDPRPKIVTNLTAAVSAPLPQGRDILKKIVDAFPDFHVVDIGQFHCLHPYDVLGIMDAAQVIVSIDTLTLHLAQACKAPLVALVRDGWEGSMPRFNCTTRLTYSEVLDNPSKVIKAIDPITGLV